MVPKESQLHVCPLMDLFPRPFLKESTLSVLSWCCTFIFHLELLPYTEGFMVSPSIKTQSLSNYKPSSTTWRNHSEILHTVLL